MDLSIVSPLNISLFALAMATLLLWAESDHRRWLIYLTKPAATIAILLLALRAQTAVDPVYHWAIVIGLLFALAGDIFLMLPADRFLAGLVSFLLTHLCYIVAFAGQSAPPYWSPIALLLPLYGGACYALLHHHVGKMRLPVLVYMGAILVMAWLALAMAWQQQGRWATVAAWGSILFVLSDSALALNRFRRPFAAAQWVVLSTYFVAQWLIAWSLY